MRSRTSLFLAAVVLVALACTQTTRQAADWRTDLRTLAEELPKVKSHIGGEAWSAGKYEAAAKLFDEITTGEYVDFLTLPAYERID